MIQKNAHTKIQTQIQNFQKEVPKNSSANCICLVTLQCTLEEKNNTKTKKMPKTNPGQIACV